MGMMTLGLDKGAEISVEAEGEDEAQAVGEVTAYLKNEKTKEA